MHKYTIANYMQKLTVETTKRILGHKRILIFDFLSDTYIFHDERVHLRNINKFRAFCLGLIRERIEVMKQNPGYSQNHSDFLTIMLEDELFQDNEEMMMDECATFFLGSTQTTQALLSCAVFYYIMNKDKRLLVRNELIQKMSPKIKEDTLEEWF